MTDELINNRVAVNYNTNRIMNNKIALNNRIDLTVRFIMRRRDY